ncbi:hypothetical protein F0562_004064 [Nyssa sinensis]|uniref:Uncharacterized protein n=1 Tax=Nyssa sinensis TaxID=561372 RepID=A0A5J5BX65_9ASTE|nr:hypothetical protein F0562_004064 [Nyssa sinensis]
MEGTSNSRREELKAAAENGIVVVSSEDRDLHDDADREVDSIERIFESIEVPPWRSQLTFRALFVSFVLGVLFTFISMKLNLTTGIIPSFNVSAGLLGFFFVKTWTKLLQRSGLLKQNFTRQENTIMIINFKLTYPSGTATAHLINSFHTQQGAKLAKQHVRTVGKFFTFSFLWSFFQWFFTGGNGCGFVNFPTFGLKAYKNRFYFDFAATYVGIGMICPYLVNISLLVGGILSWGIMWPLIEDRKGHWYPANLSPTSLQGLEGYRVFISIAAILGDGLYNFAKVLGRTLFGLYHKLHDKDSGTALPVDGRASPVNSSLSYDDQRRTQLFVKDQIPTWFSIVGYVTIAIVSTATLPHIFPQLKWYYIVVIYIFAPALAFCNAYGSGLTDLSSASTYGILAIFVIGAWAGASRGGVLAGLAACGVMMNIVSTASDLMQDFKTGYMTLASPRSMFVSQSIGTAMGCVISPCVFWLFYRAFHGLGIPGSEYPAPYALVYRNISIMGVEGFSALPKHCLTLCCVFFAVTIVINAIRDAVGKERAKFIPLPMAMALPFYLGPYFAIDMCVGSLILFIWEKMDKTQADTFGPAVASGLICGDGIWALPSSVLALAGVNPPICMKFLSRGTNANVDAFLGSRVISSGSSIDMCVGSLILFIWQKINKAKADALGPAVASGLICGDGLSTLPSSIGRCESSHLHEVFFKMAKFKG